MQKLEISVQAAGEPAELAQNIRAALDRGLPEFTPAPCPHDGTIVLVGSGPSVTAYFDEIKAHKESGKPICSIKGTHDWLCENGLEPDLWVDLDPRDKRNGVQRKNDHTTYLLASRCDPVMFDHLADKKILLWNSWSSDEEMKEKDPRIAAVSAFEGEPWRGAWRGRGHRSDTSAEPGAPELEGGLNEIDETRLQRREPRVPPFPSRAHGHRLPQRRPRDLRARPGPEFRTGGNGGNGES